MKPTTASAIAGNVSHLPVCTFPEISLNYTRTVPLVRWCSLSVAIATVNFLLYHAPYRSQFLPVWSLLWLVGWAVYGVSLGRKKVSLGAMAWYSETSWAGILENTQVLSLKC